MRNTTRAAALLGFGAATITAAFLPPSGVAGGRSIPILGQLHQLIVGRTDWDVALLVGFGVFLIAVGGAALARPEHVASSSVVQSDRASDPSSKREQARA